LIEQLLDSEPNISGRCVVVWGALDLGSAGREARGIALSNGMCIVVIEPQMTELWPFECQLMSVREERTVVGPQRVKA